MMRLDSKNSGGQFRLTILRMYQSEKDSYEIND